MMQTGFYERKRMSPGAVAVVVLLHGAAITALMMAKEGGFGHLKPPRTIVDLIQPDKDPPPKPKPPEPHPQQREVVTRTPPIIDLLTFDRTPQPPKPLEWPRLDPLPGPTTIEAPPTPAPQPPRFTPFKARRRE